MKDSRSLRTVHGIPKTRGSWKRWFQASVKMLSNHLKKKLRHSLQKLTVKKQFVEQVVKMTGENEGDIEKEYDEDYKKFTAFAEEEGYTRRRAVDKYVEISNKKLQSSSPSLHGCN